MTKAEIRKIKKGIELIELVLSDLQKSNGSNIISILRRDSFHHIFYNDNRLEELFLAIIPTERIEFVLRVLLIVKTASGSIDGTILSQYGQIDKTELMTVLNEFLEYLKSTIALHGFTVFYSWQTDISSKINRNFIENSLEKAIKNACDKTKLPLQLDKDTANRDGSPDIVHTILEKIDQCLLFVADISITQRFDADGGIPRFLPNANVLYELGYAHGILGEGNIIMVFNEATGNVESLPFDLRGRRIMKYRLDGDASEVGKKEIKKQLSLHLEHAIIHIVNSDLR